MSAPDDSRKTRHSGETRLPEANSEDDIHGTDTGFLNTELPCQTYIMPQNRLQKDTHGSGSHEVRPTSSSVICGWNPSLVRISVVGIVSQLSHCLDGDLSRVGSGCA